MTAAARKVTSAAVKALPDRVITAIITTEDEDRAGDVVVASGLDVTAYRRNPVCLWSHDPAQPIGRCIALERVAKGWSATVQFPPVAIDETADRIYGLVKAGVVNGVSIGFRVLDFEPIPGGNGLRITKSELLEFSFVATPCNANALVTARSAAGSTAQDRKWEVEAARAVVGDMRRSERAAAVRLAEADAAVIALRDFAPPSTVADRLAEAESARHALASLSLVDRNL